MASIILIRGGGDLATGIAIRLVCCGLRIAITELPEPLAIRRTVSFAEAIYSGEITIEGITGQCVKDPTDTLGILSIFGKQKVPVLVDPDCISAKNLHPAVIVDGRMTKRPPTPIGYIPQLYVGLGPGFEAGKNCQAVVETRRSHTLGRVYFQGSPVPDTGTPEGNPERVLRAPCDGVFTGKVEIGAHVEQGQIVAEIEGANSITAIQSPLQGVLRGLLHSGLIVSQGFKVGDVDPRDDLQACIMVSDKALAIGGGVLEAILSRPELRTHLWA